MKDFNKNNILSELKNELSSIIKDRENIIIDKERDIIEDEERGVPSNEWEDTYYNTEIYKYDFCIDRISSIISNIDKNYCYKEE